MGIYRYKNSILLIVEPGRFYEATLYALASSESGGISGGVAVRFERADQLIEFIKIVAEAANELISKYIDDMKRYLEEHRAKLEEYKRALEEEEKKQPRDVRKMLEIQNHIDNFKDMIREEESTIEKLENAKRTLQSLQSLHL